jgi:chromosome segregation protein
MQPNPLFRATVRELEVVLPPRVVSRALHDGLAQLDRDAASLSLHDVEQILKGVVFRHLQVTTPAEQARATVAALLERLTAADTAARAEPESAERVAPPQPHAPAAAPSPAVSMRLEALRAALRPFNLYFDWAEVRKLRAQAQAIEQEIAAGGDVETSFAEAEAQLRLVEQKLEDQLVLQARDLGELEEALAVVQALGGPRVRRLEALVGQVRLAQLDRTLADAEIERGRRLARDLRKLLESSVFSADAPPDTALEGRRRPLAPGRPPSAAAGTHPALGGAPGTPLPDDIEPLPVDRERLSAEVTERLLRLDLEAEAKDLATLRDEHAELLRYLPALEARFTALAGRLEADASVAADLEGLGSALAETAAGLRSNLAHELEALAHDVAELHPDVEAAALQRALRVTHEVLTEGLPSFADVSAIRDLHRSALERSEELARRDADARSRSESQVRAQIEVLERLDAALARPGLASAGFGPQRDELRRARDELAAAVASGATDADVLERARRCETRWERAVAEQADDERERLRARLRSDDARLSALPELGSVRARATDLRDEVARLLDEADLREDHVGALTALVDGLHADAIAETAHRLDALGREAGEAVGEAVLRELQAAARSLDTGGFPDLAGLRLVIDQERATVRDRDLARLQRLQLEGGRLDASGVDAVDRLRGALATARSELDAGRPATRHLDAAETAVGEVDRQMHERLDAFAQRLDDALARFVTVERLNNDEVASARRILTHLDSQRDAITRVSPGLQHQLVASLAEAESLLDALGEAYEATRAIADQLVSGSRLDDVLGFLGDRGEVDPLDDAPPGAPPGDRELSELTATIGRLDGVHAVLVVDGVGRVRAGERGALDEVALAQALRAADDAWRVLGTALGEERPELVDLEAGGRRLVVAPLAAGACLVVVGDTPSDTTLTARVRHQRDALAASWALTR